MDLATRLSILLGAAVITWLSAFKIEQGTPIEVATWLDGKPMILQTWSELGRGFHPEDGTKFVYVIDDGRG